MDLKKFISKTVSDIIEGIDDASSSLKDKGKSVGLFSIGKSNPRHIEFDVAVVASDKDRNNTGASGEIKVWGVFQAGVKGQTTSEQMNSTISRLKFGIRIQDIKKK